MLRRPARQLSDASNVETFTAALRDGASPVGAVDALPIDSHWKNEKLAASRGK